MGDFDAVLERLLMDEPFRVALAADPDAALSGYRLSADEVGLLRSQVSTGGGDQRTVESRNTKSSLFGMLGSIVGLAEGAVPGPGVAPPEPGHGTFGPGATETFRPGATETFGAPARETFGTAGAQTFGTAGTETFGTAGAQTLGPAGTGSIGTGTFGPADALGSGQAHAMPMPSGDHAPAGYHPHIDADGDGRWDHYTAVQHADGSVDIYEDRNHDGRVDFIGHDRNHDGRVESADYDNNFDGTFETRMRDLNGDGWLDTRTVAPDPPSGGTS